MSSTAGQTKGKQTKIEYNNKLNKTVDNTGNEADSNQ